MIIREIPLCFSSAGVPAGSPGSWKRTLLSPVSGSVAWFLVLPIILWASELFPDVSVSPLISWLSWVEVMACWSSLYTRLSASSCFNARTRSY